jgi:alpha-L-arabinofuranosidase
VNHEVYGGLDVSAAKSADGKTLVLQVANAGEKAATVPLEISGFVPAKSAARVLTLAGSLGMEYSATAPAAIKPTVTEWQHGLKHGKTTVTLPAHSFTVSQLQRG